MIRLSSDTLKTSKLVGRQRWPSTGDQGYPYLVIFRYTERSDNLSSGHRLSLTWDCLFQTRYFWMLFSEEITDILSENFMTIRQYLCHSAKGMCMWKWMLSPGFIKESWGTMYSSNMMLLYSFLLFLRVEI